MSDPYLGEIRLFAGNFAPVGWSLCNGQLRPISENEALYSLLGTIYGGDGQTTFAMPDLRGRVPIHRSNDHVLGETGGVETVTVTVSQTPAHSHPALASSGAATDPNPARKVLGEAPLADLYDPGGEVDVSLAPVAVGPAGANQPHENMMPFLCIHYIICVEGIYPPRP